MASSEPSPAFLPPCPCDALINKHRGQAGRPGSPLCLGQRAAPAATQPHAQRSLVHLGRGRQDQHVQHHHAHLTGTQGRHAGRGGTTVPCRSDRRHYASGTWGLVLLFVPTGKNTTNRGSNSTPSRAGASKQSTFGTPLFALCRFLTQFFHPAGTLFKSSSKQSLATFQGAKRWPRPRPCSSRTFQTTPSCRYVFYFLFFFFRDNNLGLFLLTTITSR